MRRWCAWDSNPGPQDGRRRQNHGAMAATHISILYKHIRHFFILFVTSLMVSTHLA